MTMFYYWLYSNGMYQVICWYSTLQLWVDLTFSEPRKVLSYEFPGSFYFSQFLKKTFVQRYLSQYSLRSIYHNITITIKTCSYLQHCQLLNSSLYIIVQYIKFIVHQIWEFLPWLNSSKTIPKGFCI